MRAGSKKTLSEGKGRDEDDEARGCSGRDGEDVIVLEAGAVLAKSSNDWEV